VRLWIGALVGLAMFPSGCSKTTARPAPATTSSPSSWYTLTHKAKLYADCINLAQEIVTGDPPPRIASVLARDSQIQAFGLAWTQVNYQGSNYLYTRDIQDIRVRTRSGLNGCMSFQDTLNADGGMRDAGLNRYLGYFMDHARDSDVVVRGEAPEHDTADRLDSAPHYRNAKDLDAAQGVDL
jgi:hypothetical protein